MKILAVDDEPVALHSLRRILRRRGFNDVQICDNSPEAVDRIKNEDFDLVLLDILMPEMDGIQVLAAAKPFKPDTEFVMITAMDDLNMAVQAIRLGAYDYLVKPVDHNRLFLAIERAYERKGLVAGLAGRVSDAVSEDVLKSFPGMIFRSQRVQALLSYVRVMARAGNPILITGESGTGKELVARGIHRLGPRPDGPFVAVNVASIPDTMFESQFFGHARGAFTGASSDYKGFFEQADGGTLFLDEMGELPLRHQAKLLRALEEKSIVRLGEPFARQVDFRIVSATNRDIEKSCREGKFRLDLLYRLKTVHVHLPALRERKEDILPLAEHFLKKFALRHQKAVSGFSPEAKQALMCKEYPGNIRELSNIVEHAVLLADAGPILPTHLGSEALKADPLSRTLCTLKDNAQAHVAYVLSNTDGNRKQAARILGITVRQLQRRLLQMREDPQWRVYCKEA